MKQNIKAKVSLPQLKLGASSNNPRRNPVPTSLDGLVPGVNAETVKHIAKLANLTFSEQDISKLQQQLSKILVYFAQLKDVKLAGIEATKTTTPLVNQFRQDKIKPCLSQKQALSATNRSYQGYFLVDAIFS